MVDKKQSIESSSMFGGWVPVEGLRDTLTPARNPEIEVNQEHKIFSEAMIARWDFFEYIKVKLRRFIK